MPSQRGNGAGDSGAGSGAAGHGDVGNDLPPNMGIGPLLRAQADGELSPDQTARLRGMLTDCSCGCAGSGTCSCEKFESDLRGACARVMSREGGASASLRARIEAMAGHGAGQAADHAVQQAGPADVPGGDAPVVHGAGHAGVSDSGRAAPGRRTPTRRRLPMLGAVGLMLVMVGGVLYQSLINTQNAASQQAGFAAQLASFVSTEHHRTALDTEPGRTKFTCREASRICPEFSGLLGASPTLPPAQGLDAAADGPGEGTEPSTGEETSPVSAAMTEHLVLQGAARCGVPGGPSIHVRYYAIEGRNGERHEVSLFIQRDTGRLEIEDGAVYRLNCPRSDACVWRRDGLIYYAVADDAVGCHAIRAAAGVGDPVGVVRAR